MSVVLNWLSALAVRFTPTGGIESTNVQSALAELDAETVKLAGIQSISGFKTFTSGLSGSSFVAAGGTGVVSPTFVLNGSNSGFRSIRFDTNSSARWSLRANTAIESGGEAGTNLELIAFNDSGSIIDTPISIVRAANGAVTFNRPTTFSNTTISTSTTTGCATFAGGVGVGGAIFGGSTFSLGSSIANAAAADITSNGTTRVSLIARSITGQTTSIIQARNNANNIVFSVGTSGIVVGSQYRLSGLNTLPSSATDTGTTGEIRFGVSGGTHYVALCVDTDTWVRAALATWT
jgi:hypothetical protein